MSRSPIRQAFLVVSREPALLINEIAWRWTFALAVWLLLAFTFFTYLHSLRVSNAGWYLLKSRVPPLMAQAMGDILRGSGPRLWRAAAVLLPTISILWMFAASIGRWASLRALVEDARGRFLTILGLHFLRAAAALAAWIGYLGAMLIAALAASRGYEDRPGLFLLIFFALAIFIGFFHGRLRWYLALAAILAVRDGRDTFSAIAAGFDAHRDRRRAFSSVGATIWALRLVALVLASVASLLPMVGLQAVHWRTAAAALAIITLVYFLVSDFLRVLLLAAYVEVLRDEPEPVTAAPAPPVPLEPALPATHDPQPAVLASETSDQGPTTDQLEPSS